METSDEWAARVRRQLAELVEMPEAVRIAADWLEGNRSQPARKPFGLQGWATSTTFTDGPGRNTTKSSTAIGVQPEAAIRGSRIPFRRRTTMRRRAVSPRLGLPNPRGVRVPQMPQDAREAAALGAGK